MRYKDTSKELDRAPYLHTEAIHGLRGPRKALGHILADSPPCSLLDVGCGTGTWLKAATELGVRDVLGIDGATLSPAQLHVPSECFRQVDLNSPWELSRKFDVALCMEVAEHLAPSSGSVLVECLTLHADTIIFSAACPDQPGQHHIHCQWPSYWQNLFNQHGYTCSDQARWMIWNDSEIECWYRQNLFTARRDPDCAGKEDRIAPVIHPEMAETLFANSASAAVEARIMAGQYSISWYWRSFFKGLIHKGLRLLPQKARPQDTQRYL